MSAAIALRAASKSVLVVDEQPAPGGQIWRSVETVAATETGKILGDEYRAGSEVVSRFRACGAVYEPGTQVWKIEPGWKVYLKRNGLVEAVKGLKIVLATGAQERPAPFPGWTLPGVLTVGAAQILLKTSQQIPSGPVWVVGSGPLPLLYMAQLLRAGGKVEGWIDTSPRDGWRRTLTWTGAIISNLGEVTKGLRWLYELRKAGVRRVRGATAIEAFGNGRLEGLEYISSSGVKNKFAANVLLSHEGIVPSIHITKSLDCKHVWNAQQSCWVPELDEWGQTSVQGVFVAGDGANIGGAKAACIRGQLVGHSIVGLLAGRPSDDLDRQINALRIDLTKALRLRPMLDSIYPPRESILSPTDDTIVCRCEELTAGDIRKACAIALPGPNQLKAFTRAGMGPCQGRQCGYTIANIIAEEQKQHVSHVGFYRVRPPLKPITLGELALLNVDEEGA
jgi:NADPH-dependent 2,4-dienoyl-CoA reductase/sulfur reductase-like enzyme